MTADELRDHFAQLHLSLEDAAQLLGVSSRTLRRWLEGEEIPGPAEAALKAWSKLKAFNLPWKPDEISIFQDDQDQIERHRRHAIEIADLIARVETRGGPSAPWTVDLSRHSAAFGPFEVGFYDLQNGGFSLSSYRRKDKSPDLARDMPFIEDAAYCISKAFAKARASSLALNAVAQHTRAHAGLRRRQDVGVVAGKIAALATSASKGQARYEQFEENLRELHALRFFPELELVSAVAQAMA